MRRGTGSILGAVWGVAGVLAVLADALIRLSSKVSGAFAEPLEPLHWIVLVGWCFFMVYVEGYAGFHKRFSPRVVARAIHIRDHPRWLDVIFAPLFCMGFYRATRRRLAVAWILASGIVILILLIRQLAQPWRGLIDIGVILGLSVGALSILYWAAMAMRGHELPFGADVSEAHG